MTGKSALLFLTLITFGLSVVGGETKVENLINEGTALNNATSYDIAIPYFDEAISMNSSNSEAWYGKGFALENEGAFERDIIKAGSYNEEAKKCLEEAIQLNPNYEDAYRELAWTESMLGNSEKGIELINKAINMDPNDAEAINVKGEIFFEMGRYSDALPFYYQASRIDPNNSNAWFNIGKTLKITGGDNAAASEAFKKASDLDNRTKVS